MKKCPYCAEDIQDAAIVCRYCGRDLQTKQDDAAPNVWKQGAKTSAILTGLYALSSCLKYQNAPAELIGNFIFGIPITFIAWWLISAAIIAIWQKIRTRKHVDPEKPSTKGIINFQLSPLETRMIIYAIAYVENLIDFKERKKVMSDYLIELRGLTNRSPNNANQYSIETSLDMLGSIYFCLRMLETDVEMALKYGAIGADQFIASEGVRLSELYRHLPIIETLWNRVGELEAALMNEANTNANDNILQDSRPEKFNKLNTQELNVEVPKKKEEIVSRPQIEDSRRGGLVWVIAGILFALIITAILIMLIDSFIGAEPEYIPNTNTSLPFIESSYSKTMNTLRTNGAHTLEEFASETYDYDVFFQPVTISYTVNFTKDKNIFISVTWCAINQNTLMRNLKSHGVSIAIDNIVIPNTTLHAYQFTVPPNTDEHYLNGLTCVTYGIITSNWSIGTHQVLTSGSFDERIFNGYRYYEAGLYTAQYNIIVTDNQRDTLPTPTP